MKEKALATNLVKFQAAAIAYCNILIISVISGFGAIWYQISRDNCGLSDAGTGKEAMELFSSLDGLWSVFQPEIAIAHMSY